MTHLPCPSSLPATAPELVRRFGAILMALAAVVARRFYRDPKLMALTLPLWSWLSRSVQRFGRTITRKSVVRAACPARVRVRAVCVPRVRLPSRRGWLVGVLGYEAAGYGSQLEHLLAEPDMQALVAALPGLARIVRPLQRMLGLADGAAVIAGRRVNQECGGRRCGRARDCRRWRRGDGLGYRFEIGELLSEACCVLFVTLS